MLQQNGRRVSSFSVILIMVVLMIVGAAVLPLLRLQYSPSPKQSQVSVSFNYPASARVTESEVTSVIEGALNTIGGIDYTRAESYQGGGYVQIRFKDDVDIETARFEVSTHLRQIKNKLPEGVNPYVSGSVSGSGGNPMIMSYTINADMPPEAIARYAEEHIVTPLSRIDGVESVSTSGAMPFQWVIRFDPDALRAAGLTPNHLTKAFGDYFRNDIAGTMVTTGQMMLVRLKMGGSQSEIEQIPVAESNGRLFVMGDFARVTYEEKLPTQYNRINGLNTIDVYVFGAEGINTIGVCAAVKQMMEKIRLTFPPKFAIEQTSDASVSLKREINKILFRAGMSLAILLLFVLLVSRSLRYLAIIGLTILANLLAAAIFYCLFGIDIELYSMAGITVSLGIIIDTAIVVADHYTYYGNRRVMGAVTGALLTTIAALLMVFFLPQEQLTHLSGFIWVIVINLSLSLAVAFWFVPALLDKMPLRQRGVANTPVARKRKIVRFTARYARLIAWCRGHRWIFIVVLILGFGLPVNLLPTEVRHSGFAEYDDAAKKGGLVGFYNETIGGKWYQKNKEWFENILGGSFNLFCKKMNGGGSFYREAKPEKILRVEAQMPEGCSVQQLNDIVIQMENWLSQFDEISDFRTSLSGTNGSIEIRFKKEFEHSRFPYVLKDRLWRKACGYGGATWYVSALDENDRSLSNSVYRTSWSNSITLLGYNYDQLYRYAEELIDTLKNNRRVSDAGFSVGWNSFVGNEFRLDFDRKRITQTGINVRRYFDFLGEQMYHREIGQVFDGTHNTPVMLSSQERDYFDLWHIRNDMVVIDSVITRLNDVGSVVKSRTGLNITRENQEYSINVGFEYVGSWELRSKLIEKQVDRLNKTLPMGFRAKSGGGYYWSGRQKRQQAGLLFGVVAVILMICSALFESFKKPLVIILMIPVSFIGLFLVYPIFGVTFDQGGYAAMVMLCGIVVNAGIYLTAEFNTVSAISRRPGLASYLKAFNRKIVPTMLTIVSTVLGLIPFLFDGNDDVFWFAFAIGVIGGMVFSIIALALFMPVFFDLGKRPAQSELSPN